MTGVLKVLVSTLQLNILKYRERAVAVRAWKSHDLPIERDSQVFHSIQMKVCLLTDVPHKGKLYLENFHIYITQLSS